MDLPFPPGHPAHHAGPLARFLPPLDEGSATLALEGFGAPGDLVLDPFGASPRLAVEAAQAGRAMIVAAHNPVNRFLLRHIAQPFSVAELQTALARLAAASKNGSRLEVFLQDLYRTECARCGQPVTADYFVWAREVEGPALKAYACEHCNHAGEVPATQADWERAQQYARKGLQTALALEQVAPAGDPYRQHAEAALSVYPGRVLYALITLVGKLGQLDLEPRVGLAAQALLLSAFDATNALWGHPEGRTRPHQLSASPRFREANVWRALERAVDEWAVADPGVPVVEWQRESPPGPGTIAIHAGHAREIAQALGEGVLPAVLTVLPRPNQAYWTLSALWAAWLWGKETAAPVRVALRRRRYDWGWHAAALRTTMAALAPALPAGTPALALVPEAEAGFTAAALAGLDGAGFRLTGRAVRAAEGQAIFTWAKAGPPAKVPEEGNLQQRLTEAAVAVLRQRGEPCPYILVHAAGWCDLAREQLLAPLWQAEEGNPLTYLAAATDAALGDRQSLVRLGPATEPESGLYWLAHPEGAALPLVERVELQVLAVLRREEAVSETDVDADVCRTLPGLLTPDRRFVQACLRSYATLEPDGHTWRLRPEDRAEARTADLQQMQEILTAIGTRLGFQVAGDDPLVWKNEQGTAFSFRVRETAGLGVAWQALKAGPETFVLPGGRASLVAEMARRDPRLKDWLGREGRVIKFRHMRRLADETTLRLQNLAERLAIDPPEHRDPQLPLL